MRYSPALRATDLRADLASGALRGEALFELLASVPFRDRDTFADALLGFPEPPPDDPALPRGVVPYLPCGVDEILALVKDTPVRAEDELVDIGAGLGRVAILVHLLTGARARGVEIQAQLVALADERRADLALEHVSFTHANAADIALDGSVFFLYAPCNGALLAAVLARVEEVARRRSIRVCAVGLELHGVAWLALRRTENALSIYDSVPRV